MGILRVIRSWFAAPQRSDFYGRADTIRRVPAAELAVSEAALMSGGPLGERFSAQLRNAPDVYRLISDDGTYELRISTTNVVRGVPRAGWQSRPIPVNANGRAFEMWIDVTIAGIVGIHGRTQDGLPWPSEWRISEDQLGVIRAGAPWIDLPTPAEIREERMRAATVVEGWLGESGLLRGKRGVVAAEPPASPDSIAAFEAANAFLLPSAYRDLLLVANGIEIGSLVVLGTDDAYRLDIPGPDRLVITPPDELGAFVLAPTGEVRFVDLEERTSQGQRRAPDLRAWVRRQVTSRSRP